MILPIETRLGAHPAPSVRGIEQDLRTITFEDWMLYIIMENKHKLPWNKK